MVLQIDTSAPFLRPSQLLALVRAVSAADPHDEHRWIEWKSRLDLATSAGQGHIARTVIGLANRQPAAAAQWAGGYGYLLIGVEPGSVAGVTPVDPEILVGQIGAAVGDALRWTPEYVTVDGAQVLVVVVDPPRPGDPIYCMRKTLERMQAGTVYVRHTGRTDPATPADLEMLQARLLDRLPGLQLALEAMPMAIETSPSILEAAEHWVKKRRPALLGARHRPAQRSSFWGGIPDVAVNALGQEVVPDKRTEAEYAAEVEDFLERAENAFVSRALWALYRHELAMLRVLVTNPTDLGYKAVRLVVHVPNDVKCYRDELLEIAEHRRVDFPTPPRPLGTPTVTQGILRDFGQYQRIIPNIAIPNIGPHFGPGPGYTVRDTGSVDIEYDEFDIRPGDEYALDPVPLIVNEDAGTMLPVTWYATASDVRGRLSGEFTLTVDESTLDLSGIDEDPTENSDD